MQTGPQHLCKSLRWWEYVCTFTPGKAETGDHCISLVSHPRGICMLQVTTGIGRHLTSTHKWTHTYTIHKAQKVKKKLYALHLDSEILLGKEIKRIKESSQRQPKRKKKDIHQNIGKNRFVRSDKTAYFLLQIIAQFLSQFTRDLRIKFKSSRQQVRAQPCCCPRCDLAQLAAEPQFT